MTLEVREGRYRDVGTVVKILVDEGVPFALIDFSGCTIKPVSIKVTSLEKNGISPVAVGVILSANLLEYATTEGELNPTDFRIMEQPQVGDTLESLSLGE